VKIDRLSDSELHRRVVQIINEFDLWLARQVREHDITWEQLPAVNDAFRDYFKDTRTSKTS